MFIRLGLFYPHNLPVFVVSTLRADAVLQARLLAIRTEAGLRQAQSIMCAAFAAASFRMSSLWIWHNYSVGKSVNGK
jgi:hypothetical protein